MHTVAIGSSLKVGPGQKLLVIAGPCQIESRDHCLRHAEFLVKVVQSLPISLVFKSSFDKANRTSITGQRGIGIDEGLAILSEVRSSFGIPVLTDVHSEEQARTAGPVVDVIQTPAFLCRQTDLLIAAGKYGKAINVKKGQFLHPSDMSFVAEKVASSGNNNILLCERGTCLGYRELVVDMRSFGWMRSSGYPVVFDATHSVQQTGGAGGSSSGTREFVSALARGAVAVGVDGIFMECHEDPARAPSDGPCMLPLAEIGAVLTGLCKIREAVQ